MKPCELQGRSCREVRSNFIEDVQKSSPRLGGFRLNGNGRLPGITVHGNSSMFLLMEPSFRPGSVSACSLDLNVAALSKLGCAELLLSVRQ